MLRAVDPQVFRGFVSVLGGIEGKKGEIRDSSIHEEQTIPPSHTNRTQTVHKDPQTSGVKSGPLTVVPEAAAAASAAPWCHFQVDHQLKHRDVQTTSPWCEICSPERAS